MQSIICSCVHDTAAEVKHTCSMSCIKVNEVEITDSTTSWLGPSKQATMETEYICSSLHDTAADVKHVL